MQKESFRKLCYSSFFIHVIKISVSNLYRSNLQRIGMTRTVTYVLDVLNLIAAIFPVSFHQTGTKC